MAIISIQSGNKMYSVRSPCETQQNIYIFVKFKIAYNSELYGLVNEMGKEV